MQRHTKTKRAVVMLAMGLAACAPQLHARSSYGPWVDGACQAFNGTQPYAEQTCSLCHTSNLGQRVDPEWTWWEQQTLTEFCPPVANSPPNGRIDLPLANASILAGETVVFEGTATDPDAEPQLFFRWRFGGGAPDATVEDPGAVRFDVPGTFTVTFTVTDSLGVADPTPGTRTVRVAQVATACTDTDGDGFAVEGRACGQVDCNDNAAAINPAAAEICDDGVDNNCNALVDQADPVAVGCPVAAGCSDRDGDGFSREGGVCGPVDCDDRNPASTVQCRQTDACRRQTECLADLFPPGGDRDDDERDEDDRDDERDDDERDGDRDDERDDDERDGDRGDDRRVEDDERDGDRDGERRADDDERDGDRYRRARYERVRR